MRSIADEGIVLRKHAVGEKDEVVVMLTKAGGKLAFMSKGSRSPKSKKSAVLQLMNTVAFQAHQGRGKLPYLQQVAVVTSRGFDIVASSLEDYERAISLLRMIDKHLDESQFVQNVYEDSNAALDAVFDPGVRVVFFIHLLTDLGFLPDWRFCVSSADKIDLSESLVFSTADRGFAQSKNCQNVADRTWGLLKSVDSDLVKVMSYWQHVSLADALKVEVDYEILSSAQELLDMIDVS